MNLDICIGCKIAKTVLVVARDFRGVTTALCLTCGAADEVEASSAAVQDRSK